jgi:putative nucleotidyltransferase with HDIG domain
MWAKALLLAVGYVIAAEIGNLLSAQNTFATFWPPAGLFMAALLISERKDWPLLIAAGIAGNLCSDLLQGHALLVTVGFAAAHAIEALAGAVLVGALSGARPKLDSLREAFNFSAVGAVLAPVLGASIGAAVVTASTPGAVWWTVWYTWYIGDVLGIVLVGSVLLAAVGQWDTFRSRREPGLSKLLTPLARSLLIAVPFSILAFGVFSPMGGATSWKFTVTPGIVTCAITGGPLGAAAGLLVIALGGLAGMVGAAPNVDLAGAAYATSVLQAQAFFAVGGVTALCLSGVIAENRVNAASARQVSERFRLLYDTMREGVSYCRMIFDRDGRPMDWVYLQVNPAFERITGMHDVVGRHVWELLPDVGESNRELLEVYGWTAATGEPAVVETRERVPGRTLRISVTSPARGDFAAVMEDVTDRVAGEKLLAESNTRLEKMVYDVAAAMGSVVEARDPYTQGHELRVADLARRIAAEMGLAEDELDGISMAGLLHDIGKLRIPAEILTKPGVLSPAEFSLIKEHPRGGYEILHHIEFPWPVAETVLRHHERLDGSGYPDGLRDGDIPLLARVLAVADTVEAMSSHRPYRPIVGLPQAIEEISSNLQRYDAEVVRACVRLYERGEIGL